MNTQELASLIDDFRQDKYNDKLEVMNTKDFYYKLPGQLLLLDIKDKRSGNRKEEYTYDEYESCIAKKETSEPDETGPHKKN